MGFKSFEGDPKALIALDLYIENSDSKSRSASLASGKRIYTAPFPGTPHYKEVIFSSSRFPRGKIFADDCLGVLCIGLGFHPLICRAIRAPRNPQAPHPH